jgi:RNA ligase (TIGR02306 family)
MKMPDYTHRVEIVKLKIENHPNADKLQIARIFSFTCCVGKEQFQDGDLAAYIQPDSVVDSTRPEFDFLKGHERIRVRRLRGVVSMGLVMPCPEGMVEGDDAAEFYGVTHYEPGMVQSVSDEMEPPPVGIYIPKYDVESMYRFRSLFHDGEEIVATEKIHGANSRFMFHGDRMWCGSRGEWKKPSDGNLWWRALAAHPWIEKVCREFPDDVIYGEVFGNVQSLKYGATGNEVFFRAFDILRSGEYLNYSDFESILGVDQRVPVLYCGPFDFDALVALSDGKSTLADHMREGIVVRPIIERRDDHIGRIQFKLVSNEYLSKA